MGILDERKFSVPQAAKALGVCPDTVYALIRKSELKAMRIGKKFVVAESQLSQFCEDSVYDPSSETKQLRGPRHATATDLLPSDRRSSTKDLDACLRRIRRHRRTQTAPDKGENTEDSGNTELS